MFVSAQYALFTGTGSRASYLPGLRREDLWGTCSVSDSGYTFAHQPSAHLWEEANGHLYFRTGSGRASSSSKVTEPVTGRSRLRIQVLLIPKCIQSILLKGGVWTALNLTGRASEEEKCSVLSPQPSENTWPAWQLHNMGPPTSPCGNGNNCYRHTDSVKRT